MIISDEKRDVEVGVTSNFGGRITSFTLGANDMRILAELSAVELQSWFKELQARFPPSKMKAQPVVDELADLLS